MSEKKQLSPAERAAARAEWRRKAIGQARKNGYEPVAEDAVTGAIGFIRTGPKPTRAQEPARVDGYAVLLVLAVLGMVIFLLTL